MVNEVEENNWDSGSNPAETKKTLGDFVLLNPQWSKLLESYLVVVLVESTINLC